MIALTRKRRRRTRRGYAPPYASPGQRKCTEPVASSSDLPTDHRRSDNHSESHQPRTLRTRCIADSTGRSRAGQAPAPTKSAQFAANAPCDRSGHRTVDSRIGRLRDRVTKKCTEPVAPSSGFPTDRRRSDCRSESHQPRTLRTRCIADSRGAATSPSRQPDRNFSQIAIFSFRTASNCDPLCALAARGDKKRPGTRARPQRIRRAGNAFVHLPDEPSASA